MKRRALFDCLHNREVLQELGEKFKVCSNGKFKIYVMCSNSDFQVIKQLTITKSEYHEKSI